MKSYPFPHHVKDKERLLFWTQEQVLPFIGMCMVGIVTDMLTIFMIIGVAFGWAYSRYSDGKPDGYLLHKAYWMGLMPMKGRGFIHAYHRRILPK